MNEETKKNGIVENVKDTAEFVGGAFLAGFVLSAVFTAFGLGVNAAGKVGDGIRNKMNKNCPE